MHVSLQVPLHVLCVIACVIACAISCAMCYCMCHFICDVSLHVLCVIACVIACAMCHFMCHCMCQCLTPTIYHCHLASDNLHLITAPDTCHVFPATCHLSPDPSPLTCALQVWRHRLLVLRLPADPLVPGRAVPDRADSRHHPA